jgi:hypothetical protein
MGLVQLRPAARCARQPVNAPLKTSPRSLSLLQVSINSEEVQYRLLSTLQIRHLAVGSNQAYRVAVPALPGFLCNVVARSLGQRS